MPTATYALYVDWANDGSFATGGDDISADVLSASIERSFASPLARCAGVGRATFLLRNHNKQYSPALQANVLPRRPVRFDMTYAAVTETLFRGYIERIAPAPDVWGPRTAVLECVDALALLDLHEGPIGLQTNTLADTLIAAIVSAVYTPPSTAYQKGISTFPISADKWGVESDPLARRSNTELTRAGQKITEVCASDWGRFFIGKNGAPTFKNRHATIGAPTALTVSGELLALNYEKKAGDVLNAVSVTAHPRAVGETLEVIARQSQGKAAKIEASASITIELRFTDPSNASQNIGGISVITPIAGTDYTATDDEAGEGTDMTASVTAAATVYADKISLTLTNAHATQPAYVQTVQARGYAVRARQAVTLTAKDDTSITAYQRRELSLNAPLMNTESDAQRLAEHLLARLKDPRDVVTGVTISGAWGATYLAACRDLELLDKVVLTETQTGLSGYAGHIYKMSHRIEPFEHRLSFDLETAFDPGTPFRLDTSALNSGHRLIY